MVSHVLQFPVTGHHLQENGVPAGKVMSVVLTRLKVISFSSLPYPDFFPHHPLMHFCGYGSLYFIEFLELIFLRFLVENGKSFVQKTWNIILVLYYLYYSRNVEQYFLILSRLFFPHLHLMHFCRYGSLYFIEFPDLIFASFVLIWQKFVLKSR
jgi:hypothetical protein